jgi:hypothetical protein
MKMIYLDKIQQMDRSKELKTVAEQESLMLSLAGGTLRCHSYPSFEQIEVLDCD